MQDDPENNSVPRIRKVVLDALAAMKWKAVGGTSHISRTILPKETAEEYRDAMQLMGAHASIINELGSNNDGYAVMVAGHTAREILGLDEIRRGSARNIQRTDEEVLRSFESDTDNDRDYKFLKSLRVKPKEKPGNTPR